jgi:hypothetical protein
MNLEAEKAWMKIQAVAAEVCEEAYSNGLFDQFGVVVENREQAQAIINRVALYAAAKNDEFIHAVMVDIWNEVNA